MTEKLARVPWVAIAVFIVVSFGLAWLAALPLWLSGTTVAVASPVMVTLTGTVMMATPAIAALVVVFAMRTPARERLRFLGMWPLRPARRVVWSMVAAMFGPVIIVVLTALIAAAFGWVRLDLVNFSGFAEQLAVQTASLDPLASTPLPPIGLLVLLQLLMIPIGSLINSVFAFGEELGWRGWLLPALRPLGVWPALLLSGVIWGLWHSPLILLGYNFGYTDWRGVALMVGGCVAWGVIFGWARLRSASLWPAVIGHGALNASAGMVVLFAAAGADIDMGLVGPLGVVAWAVIAVTVAVIALFGQFKKEPELARFANQRAIP